MKRIITSVLALLMLTSCICFVHFASAQDSGVLYTIDYAEQNKGIVDNKQTAVTEKVQIDGLKAVKITPAPDTAQSSEIRMDCYGLAVPSEKIKGTKYITVKYRYDGAAATKPMTLHFFNFGEYIPKAVTLTAKDATVSGSWKVAVFDAAALGDTVVDGKTMKQFHFWPYGQGVDPKGMKPTDVMFISDITFYSKTPEGITLPTTTEASAPSSAKPAEPAKPSEPAPSTKIEGALEGDENGFIFSFSYQDKCNGVVDKKMTANVEKVTEDGQKAIKAVPTPETALTPNIILDCYSFYCKPSEIANARFMSFKYKLVAPETESFGKMGMRILGGASKRVITRTIDADSLLPLKVGEWSEAVFNISAIDGMLSSETDSSLMLQFHLYPFGKSANVNNMNGNYAIYISDVSFYSLNPDKDTTYEVHFKKGHPDISGDDPAPMTVKRGTRITIPEHTYDLGKAEFLGWGCSEDGKTYNAGDEYTVPDNNVLFTAKFNTDGNLESYRALDFTAYQNGSCERRDNITVTNDVFQGKNVVKVVPNPKGLDASKAAIVDGYTYGPAGIDMGVYKYLVITYYLDGELPEGTHFFANIMPRKILTKAYGVKSNEPLSSGRWSFAVIDFSGAEQFLTTDVSTHVMEQMHIYPFYGTSVPALTGNETLYINSLMFFKEKPNLEIHESYMKGYDGGLFKPQGNMTRAEAATIVARLAAGSDELVPADKTTAFTDVANDQWYHKYVSYVESLGYLSSYSGTFLPNQAITRAEFVELVYNMGLLKDAGKNGTFTDVPAGHPKAAVIAAAAKAGLVNGYDNGDGTFSFKPDATITRAEVVKVINNAYGRSITVDQLSEEVKHSFNDVDFDFWAYADIMEATLSHVQDPEGWTFCMVSPYTIFGKNNDNLNYVAGEQYVKDLDATSAERIAAIKNTPNLDISKITGQKYYISNNGNDENDGKTPETAWKTIGRMVKSSSELNPGDAVLFERGGLWRERFGAKSGITYSAYGEGPKPILYGSPENGADSSKWTLHHEDAATGKKIWVYATDLLDVGAIICDGGKVIGLKEVPDFADGKYFVRGTKRTKEFDMVAEMNENYEFFSNIPTASALATQKGKVYFRCDEGNPGELFTQIEFNIKGNVISNGSSQNTHYDNLCVMYTGTHGIGSGTTKNLTVTNCEIAWIGGTLQNYKDGVATRLGNGVEIYGGCDGYLVDNNYIWQCYDAGATHQYSSGGTVNISMYNILYSNNVIEDCIYNIEYFTGYADDNKTVRDGKNFVIRNNILRRAGYGWGNQRPDGNTCAHIKSWGHRNEYEKGTYIIENNVFDRASWNLTQTDATYISWCPIYRNNVYVQYIDGGLASHAGLKLKFDCYAEESIRFELGDESATVYFLPESYKHNGFLSR